VGQILFLSIGNTRIDNLFRRLYFADIFALSFNNISFVLFYDMIPACLCTNKPYIDDVVCNL